MTRLAARLTMMFTDLPFLDRFAAAAEAGFEAVEFVSPYAEPSEAVADAARRHGLFVVLFNMPPGDWARASAASRPIPRALTSSRRASISR